MSEAMHDIVDEDDNVIGVASRKDIHAKGLLHRSVHVMFVTPDRQVIFQRRSMTKDTNPGLLTVAVGGHVDLGDSYEKTALKETQEETGLRIELSDLVLLDKIRVEFKDPRTQTHNVAYRCVYGYVFTGSLSDLHVEPGESDGYAVMDGDALFDLSDDDRKRFAVPIMDMDLYGPLYKKLLALVK